MRFIVVCQKWMAYFGATGIPLQNPSFFYNNGIRIDLLAILKKNLNRTILCYILSNLRMCTIVIEALTPLDRISCIKMYKNNARSRLFCRIAKRSIGNVLTRITYITNVVTLGKRPYFDPRCEIRKNVNSTLS